MSQQSTNDSTGSNAGGGLELIVNARQRGLTNELSVRRLLPVAARRMVGPFIFFDHLGPVAMPAGRGLDVPPHPHIGLATVTYLFDGEVMHKDSLGMEQLIRPGDLNWMHAGRGIVHSERTPAALRASGARAHMLQLWAALPTANEDDQPSFQHHPKESLPQIDRPGARLRLIAGSAWGITSPVRVHSPMFYVEALLEAGAALELPQGYPERAAYVVEGAVRCGAETFQAGVMLVFRSGHVSVESVGAARVMMLGGAPLDGPRYIEWNFVASSRERIEEAKQMWKDGHFPRVPGETEFVPLPN